MLAIGILQGWRIRVLGLLMAAFENSGRRLCPGRLAKRTKRLMLDERPDKLGWAPVFFEPVGSRNSNLLNDPDFMTEMLAN